VAESIGRAFELAGADAGLGLRPKNIGARVRRVEDWRLLTGQAAFADDRIMPGSLRAACRRSDHAHALISNIGTSARPSAEYSGPRFSSCRWPPERLFCLVEKLKARPQGELALVTEGAALDD
jgi:hypothetical protein